MMILLCECNWQIPGLDKLPPHYHYVAGRVKMPNGEEEWIAGAISANGDQCEQREFIHLETKWDHAELEAFVAEIRAGASPHVDPPVKWVWYHQDGTPCVAGHSMDMECRGGGGRVHRMNEPR